MEADRNKVENHQIIQIEEIFFYVFWAVMLVVKGLGWYDGMPEYKFCLLVAVFFIGIKLLLSQLTIKEWIVTGLLILLGFVVTCRSADKGVLIYILLLVGMKGIPVRRIFSVGLPFWGGCFLVNVVRFSFQSYKGLPLVHEKFGLGPIIRWSLGYPHPNVLHITYAILAVFILYLYGIKRKKPVALTILLFLGSCFIFMYSLSYTGFLLTLMCIFSFNYFAARKSFNKAEKIIFRCILPVCLLYAIVLPLTLGRGPVGTKITELLNEATNSRFVASQVYLQDKWTFFGMNLGGINTTFALDSSYVSLLKGGGLVIFFLFMAGYLLTVEECIRSERRRELAVILPFLIAGVSEPFLFNTSFKNLSVIFVGEWLWRKLAGKGSALLPFRLGTKTISFPSGTKLGTLCQCAGRGIRRRGKAIIAVGMITGIAAMAICAISFKKPDSIFVGSKNCDCGPREEVYLDMENLPEDFNSLVFEYNGPDSALFEFRGNLIFAEYVRSIVTWGVYGILAGLSVSAAAFIATGRKQIEDCLANETTNIQKRKN